MNAANEAVLLLVEGALVVVVAFVEVVGTCRDDVLVLDGATVEFGEVLVGVVEEVVVGVVEEVLAEAGEDEAGGLLFVADEGGMVKP